MKVTVLDSAQKEFDQLDNIVQDKFLALFEIINNGGTLDQNKLKKFTGLDLIEFRVKYNGNIFRGIGKFKSYNYIVVVFFQKKTNKTPGHIIKVALKRLNNYLN